jgi:hypothetical protein
MSADEVPVVLLLLLPGFVAVQVYNWVSRKRRLSDFETLLWVLLCSFALLAPTATVWHALDDAVPSLSQLIRNPTALPMRLAGMLYLLALPSGWVAGHLDRTRILEEAFLRLRIDLRRRHDVWHLAFRDAYYVIVYLKGGAIVYGWPLMTTSHREGAAGEIYLTNTGVWDGEAQQWVWQEDITGVWLDAASIERVELTARPKEPDP